MDALQSPRANSSVAVNTAETVSPINQIIEGDCIQGMRSLDDGSVDLVFADPPFNIGYEYDVYEDRRGRAQYLQWSREWIVEVHRVLKESGTFWLAIGDEYAAELKVASQDIGFHCRSWVVWYYTFGVNCARKFSRSHAHLFHFVKDAKNFTFRESDPENRIPSARQLVYGDRRAHPRGRLADDTWILRPQDLADCFTASEDTWYFPRVAGTFKERAGFHGCQMPEQLLGRIIRFCSNTDETVLDPFAGSSTTLVVAKKLGRNFLGFELSSEYVRRGRERLATVRRGDPLDGSPEPTVSAPATPSDSNGGSKKSKASLDTPLFAAEAAQLQKIEAFMEQGIIEAFRRTNQGYSVDRVLVDPELSEAFLATCRELGFAGDPRSWNRGLLRLRKAGRLTDIPTDRTTEIPWEESDAFLFASEIAIRQMLDRGYPSIDDIFSDPEASVSFDACAALICPGFSPFQYRWGALRLRNNAKLARTRAAALELPSVMNQPVPVSEHCSASFAGNAGVYVVKDSSTLNALYAGWTLNLQERFRRKFASESQLAQWRTHGSQFVIEYFNAESDPLQLLGYQSLMISTLKPVLNFQDLSSLALGEGEAGNENQ